VTQTDYNSDIEKQFLWKWHKNIKYSRNAFKSHQEGKICQNNSFKSTTTKNLATTL